MAGLQVMSAGEQRQISEYGLKDGKLFYPVGSAYCHGLRDIASLPVAPSLERNREPNLGEDIFFSFSSLTFCFKSTAPVPARARVPSRLLPLVLANSGAAGTIVTSSVGGDLRAILNLSFDRGVP